MSYQRLDQCQAKPNRTSYCRGQGPVHDGEKGQQRQGLIGAVVKKGREHRLNGAVAGIDGDQVDAPAGQILQCAVHLLGVGYDVVRQATLLIDVAADGRKSALVAAADGVADDPHLPAAGRRGRFRHRKVVG